jgi:hypothetical protein
MQKWNRVTHKCLKVEEKHPNDAVTRPVELKEIDKRVDRCGKGPVQPTPTLANQLHSCFWNIRFGLGRLHVGESPPGIGFGHKFETEDTILSQEHVLGKDVHAIDTLLAEASCKRVITMEVLLQWPAKDSTVAIRRESTWQH